MKPLLWIAAIPAIAVGYYFGIALPNQNEARLAFDRQQYSDGQKRQTEEKKKVQDAAKEQEARLDECIAAVEANYRSEIRLNGTVLKNGAINTPTTTLNALTRRRNEERETCLKRYLPH